MALRTRWWHALLLVTGFLSLTAADRPRRLRPVAAPITAAMSFSFVALPDGAPIAGSGSTVGSIQMGAISRIGSGRRDIAVHAKGRGLSARTRFGIVVHDGASVPRSAAVLAALPYVVPGTSISIDGVALDLSPRVIANRVVPEQVTKHDLEILVSGEVNEANAQLLNSILFTVVPE